MKNILSVNSVYQCIYCNLNGFFCYTPDGADFETCPCCGKDDFLNTITYKDYPTKYDFLFETEFEDDMRNKYRYCDSCHIIFQLGCMHYNGGCTSNVFNCHFIKKWKHKVNNIEYKGMPIFDNEDDWFNNVNNVEVLQMYCPHNKNKCKNSYHNNEDKCEL